MNEMDTKGKRSSEPTGPDAVTDHPYREPGIPGDDRPVLKGVSGPNPNVPDGWMGQGGVTGPTGPANPFSYAGGITGAAPAMGLPGKRPNGRYLVRFKSNGRLTVARYMMIGTSDHWYDEETTVPYTLGRSIDEDEIRVVSTELSDRLYAEPSRPEGFYWVRPTGQEGLHVAEYRYHKPWCTQNVTVGVWFLCGIDEGYDDGDIDVVGPVASIEDVQKLKLLLDLQKVDLQYPLK